MGTAAASPVTSGKFHLTQAELAQWRRETATPAGRARLVAELRKSFAGIARIEHGRIPRGGYAQAPWHGP